MEDSAYKAILAGYSSHHGSLEWWLQFWTWWVIIGVAFELAFIIWDHVEEYSDWSKARSLGEIPFPSKPKKVKLVLEMASVALVVFGIVGELRVDAKLGGLDTEIQRTNGDRAANLQQEADNAETAAGKAQSSARAANSSASRAQGSADSADADAKDAQGKVVVVRRQASALTGQMAAATQQLSDARAKLLDLATCLAPRIIPNGIIFNPTTKTETWSTLDPVRPFSAFQAIIEVIPNDAEAARAAKNIELSLHLAGWERVTSREKSGLPDGVQVIPWNPKEIGNRQMGTPAGEAQFERNWQAYRQVSKAADAIVDWLHSFNWTATRSGAINQDIASNAIEIEVGLYPAVQFVSAPGNKLFADLEAQLDRSQQAAREQAQADLERREDEQWAKYPPEAAARAREMRQQEREEAAKWDGRYLSQPCRLTSLFNP